MIAPLPVRRRDLVPNARRVDPTRTAGIRRSFSSDAVRRYRAVAKLVRETVVASDAFGLSTPAPLVFAAAGRNRFSFGTVEERRQAFMSWLAKQLENEQLMEVDGYGRPGWPNPYIRGAYAKAMAQVDGELGDIAPRVPGLSVPSGGITIPYHMEQLERLYARAFDDLKGITETMSVQIGQRLALGLANGWTNRQIADAIVDRVEKIGIARARTMVRTEIIATHADATLNRLEEYGVTTVSAEVEFATAGDAAVCIHCARLDGKKYSIAEARGVIPVHPNCRCAWKPVINWLM